MNDTQLTVQDHGQVAPAEDFMAVIARAARDPQVDVEKMQRLLEMAERMESHRSERAYNLSMRLAQEEMKPVVRDAQNDHTKSRYARLETIDARIRPIYTKHGFCLSFNSAEPRKAGSVRIECKVRHIDGHTELHELEGELDVAGAKGGSTKTSIQGLGSSVSYLRRYLTCMIFNIVLTSEDNDGNRVEFINDEQVLAVVDALARAGIKETDRGFLGWAGVDRIEHIMPQGFDRVMKELNRRIAQKEQGLAQKEQGQ